MSILTTGQDNSSLLTETGFFLVLGLGGLNKVFI